MSQYYATDHLRLPRQPQADDLAGVGGDSDPYGDLFERPDQTRQSSSSSSSSDAVPVFLPFPGNEKSYKRPPRQAVQQGKYWLKFMLENLFLTRLSHIFYLQLQLSPSSPVNLSQCLFRSWVERSIILEYFSRWGQSHFSEFYFLNSTLSSLQANWFKAEQYCRFHNMHLASINSAEEQRELEVNNILSKYI